MNWRVRGGIVIFETKIQLIMTYMKSIYSSIKRECGKNSLDPRNLRRLLGIEP
jgi:hypothetical protein